jgi:hypothetical protein
MLPRRVLFLGLAATCALTTAVACGGGSPSGASPVAQATPDTGLPVGALLEVVSGETSAPVAGARVTIGLRTYQSDGAGRFVLAEAAAYGTYVDVVAAGFLDRQTLLRRSASTRFVLWPDTTLSTSLGKRPFDQHYTASLVYTSSAESVAGNTPLRRLPRSATQAIVALSEELRLDDDANANHELAVNAINETLNGRFTYVLSPSRPSTGIIFEARVDASEATCANRAFAFAQVTTQGGEITGGRIVYCGLRLATRAVVLHEIGHTAGLFHSVATEDVMYPYIHTYSAHQFRQAETLALSLLFERPGGNRFPDNDRGVTASGRQTTTIVCP